jgi:hypothetical protein
VAATSGQLTLVWTGLTAADDARKAACGHIPADETGNGCRGAESKGRVFWHYDCAQRSEDQSVEVA